MHWVCIEVDPNFPDKAREDRTDIEHITTVNNYFYYYHCHYKYHHHDNDHYHCYYHYHYLTPYLKPSVLLDACRKVPCAKLATLQGRRVSDLADVALESLQSSASRSKATLTQVP